MKASGFDWLLFKLFSGHQHLILRAWQAGGGATIDGLTDGSDSVGRVQSHMKSLRFRGPPTGCELRRHVLVEVVVKDPIRPKGHIEH